MVGIASFFGIGSPKTRTEITDDEGSSNNDAPNPVVEKAKQENTGKSKSKAPVEEPEEIESENNEDEADDEELSEDEYVVEGITSHSVDEDVSSIGFRISARTLTQS